MADRLGPYQLDKRIGAGGMADVFLARGPLGVCVVKRPHPHLCATPEFVRMFLDEASLLAQLSHPGIARVFDLGQENGVFFLAMEYVPGFDLMTISLEHERQGEFMAPELAARVVADAAKALHYAHDALGTNGQPLNIIHRDVTPHNILVSTRGEVKLIDFGVAKAAQGLHRTQAGLVKGKYPYMSPEQITGQAIDRRVDVYALGLVLYELLTNARAIEGDNEVQQIDNARSARIKPVEQLRANTPLALRKIIAGCLHPEASGRYPTALHVAQELEGYLANERHVVGREDLLRLFRVVAAEASHLGPIPLEAQTAAPQGVGVSDDTLMRGSSSDDLRPTEPQMVAQRGGTQPQFDNQTLRQYATPHGPSDATLPPTAPMPAGVVVGGAAQPVPIPLTSPVPRVEGETAVKTLQRPLLLTAEAPPDPKDPSFGSTPTLQVPQGGNVPARTDPLPPPPRNVKLSLAVAGALLALGSAAAWAVWPRPDGEVSVPPGPELGLDAGVAVVVPPELDPPAVFDAGTVAEVRAPDSGVQGSTKSLDPNDTPPEDPVQQPVRLATVSVSTTPPSQVFVDGKLHGTTPLTLELVGGAHSLLFQNKAEGFRRTMPLKVKPGEQKTVEVTAEKGTLKVHVEPFGMLFIDGQKIAEATSFKELEVWTGKHQLEARNAELKQTVKEVVDLGANQTREVHLRFKMP